MANKTTVSLSKEQYKELIKTMRSGGSGFRANNRIATILVLEANLGLRISDLVYKLCLKDIIRDGERYRLNIREKKTGKPRTFTVPFEIYQYIENYCLKEGISPEEPIFPITERAVQSYLKKVADYIGYENISTHSFRKFFATEIYNSSGYNVELVRKLLQHSSVAITQRYLGVDQQVETALQDHIELL